MDRARAPKTPPRPDPAESAGERSAPALLRYAVPAAVLVPVLSVLAMLVFESERVVSLATSVALWVELEILALGTVSVLSAFAIRSADRRRRATELQLEELAHRDPLTACSIAAASSPSWREPSPGRAGTGVGSPWC